MKWFDLHNRKQPVYFNSPLTKGGKEEGFRTADDKFSEVMDKGKEPIKMTFLKISFERIKNFFKKNKTFHNDHNPTHPPITKGRSKEGL